MTFARTSGLLLLLLSACVRAQDHREVIIKHVEAGFVSRELQVLAADSMRGRDTGSPELNEAARHIADLFGRWGVRPLPGQASFLQAVPVQEFEQPARLSLKPDSLAWQQDLLAWSPANGSFSAPIAFAGFGLESDLANTDIVGKIAVLREGTPGSSVSSPATVREKYRLALAKKAAGVIEITTYPTPQWSYYKSLLTETQLQLRGNGEIPYLWLNDPGQHKIGILKAMEGETLEITAAGARHDAVETFNIVGYVEGTDAELKKEFVVLSAHYDHVGVGTPDHLGDSIYNGARDNAVGTVAVLAAARAIAQKPAKRSVIFVLFTGEEKGMLGSDFFASNPPVPLNQIVFNLNTDNAGYNDTTLVTVIGLGRTNTSPALEEACEAFGLKATNDPAPEQGLFDRSDNVSFAKRGVPALTFSMGFTGFDAEIRKHYHRPSDHAGSIDSSYLLRFSQAYVLAAVLLADMKEKPFWVQGDTYYEQGLKLYDNPIPGQNR